VFRSLAQRGLAVEFFQFLQQSCTLCFSASNISNRIALGADWVSFSFFPLGFIRRVIVVNWKELSFCVVDFDGEVRVLSMPHKFLSVPEILNCFLVNGRRLFVDFDLCVCFGFWN